MTTDEMLLVGRECKEIASQLNQNGDEISACAVALKSTLWLVGAEICDRLDALGVEGEEKDEPT